MSSPMNELVWHTDLLVTLESGMYRAALSEDEKPYNRYKTLQISERKDRT